MTTIFEHLMRNVHGPTEPVIDVGDRLIVYQPKPVLPIKVSWSWPNDWETDMLDPRRHRRSSIITFVWPAPRRMRCGKWRAAGKVYRTKALAWGGLEKRGIKCP